MTVADDHLAQVGAVLDEWDREDTPSDLDQDLPACAQEALALSDALQPVIAITIKLGAGPAPGTGADEDASWAASVALARRDVFAQRAAGIDHGLAADNLRLLARIDELTGVWSADDWKMSSAAGCTNSLTRASVAGSAAKGFVFAVGKPRSRSVSLLDGCCATQQITGCVRRSPPPLTLSAER